MSQDDEHGKGCIYTNYFGSVNEREAVRIAIEEDMARDDGRPFLIYPEGCVTTGVCAVMQYQKFVFSLDKVIVPMCLSINNPWPYEHYTLVGHAQDHLLWYLFSPWVTFKHALLPPQKRREGEGGARTEATAKAIYCLPTQLTTFCSSLRSSQVRSPTSLPSAFSA